MIEKAAKILSEAISGTKINAHVGVTSNKIIIYSEKGGQALKELKLITRKVAANNPDIFFGIEIQTRITGKIKPA